MEEKQSFIQWVKDHKKELIIAGVSIAVLIGIIAGIKNRDSLKALWNSLKKDMKKVQADGLREAVPVVEPASESRVIELPVQRSYQNQFDVRDHIRNLSQGHHASVEKIASAAEHNYILQSGQT